MTLALALIPFVVAAYTAVLLDYHYRRPEKP